MDKFMPFIGNFLLPLSLWMIMFSMGLSLTRDDFKRVIANRRAFFVGAGSMLVVVPIIGVIIALLFAPTPALAMGFILLATCPGGMLSNLLTDLAKGDLALSVSMSLIVSFIYIFTLPFIAYFALQITMGDGQVISVPILSSFGHILAITLVPIAAGMFIRAKWEWLALKAIPIIKNTATTVLVIVFGIVIYQERETLRLALGTVMIMVIGMNIANILVAFFLSKAARLSRPERTAVVIEHLIRQEATAVYVAVTLLGRTDMSIPMIVNTFIGMFFCVAFVAYLRRSQAAHVSE